MDVRVLLGQNVRRIRLKADLSQEAVAARMGVDRAYVSALELGKLNPTAITLWRIAEALEVRLAELVAEDAGPSLENERVRSSRKA